MAKLPGRGLFVWPQRHVPRHRRGHQAARPLRAVTPPGRFLQACTQHFSRVSLEVGVVVASRPSDTPEPRLQADVPRARALIGGQGDGDRLARILSRRERRLPRREKRQRRLPPRQLRARGARCAGVLAACRAFARDPPLIRQPERRRRGSGLERARRISRRHRSRQPEEHTRERPGESSAGRHRRTDGPGL